MALSIRTRPSFPIRQGHPSASALSTLSHVFNLDWQSVSHIIIYFFQCSIFLPFHTVHGALKAGLLKCFALPISSGPRFAEFSIMIRLSYVVLHSMAHSFIELDKAVVHVVRLVSFL